MKLVTEPYLLFVCVPITIDPQGCPHTDPLWVKDLALHLEYIEDMALACPVVHGPPGPGTRPLPLSGPPFDRLKLVPLPAPRGRVAALVALPQAVATAWRAIGKARIVHTGFGGWPLNEGWIACPIAKLRGKFLMTNIESSFWRATPGAAWHRRLRGFLAETLNRWWVRAADLRFFTSTGYLREFLPPGAPRAHVNPATWVDDEWIASPAAAAALWDQKTGPVRLLFAGRLIPQKGVLELLAAARTAGRMGAELDLTVVGEGPLRDDCLQASQELAGPVRLSVLEPVSCGLPFFSLIGRQDAVLVPSLSDEQPRVLFDAMSQAVPVLGSDTGGIREVVAPEATGRLVPAGDVEALAAAMVWAAHNRPTLRALGLRGLEAVRGRTHRAMHQSRGAIIRQALDGRP
ncbi:MAG TPA: glycosyltransferase family 4 protein [Isosphaeraceae bacterium]|nr:glycosyltransferase family 4 protein [Isosphaeraceae bacterium]